MSEDESIPHILARISKSTRVPWVAVILAMIASIALLALQDISLVASVTDVLIFTGFMLVNASVILLSFKEPFGARPFRIPFNIGKLPVTAVLGIFTCLALLLSFDLGIILIGVGFIIMGDAFYELTRKLHHKKKGLAF